jgi:23S rRNA pseudouridine1911/1915/1917 synthase
LKEEPGLAVRIVTLHKDFLVLNKIPGESAESLESPRDGIVDLPRLLRRELGGGDFFPVHRLDVPVSGCVLFARNRRSMTFFSECFRTPGRVEKIYWAITEAPRNAGGLNPAPDAAGRGLPALPEGPAAPYAELVHWLKAGRGNRSLAFDEEGPGRKKSVLRCRVLGRGERYLFLEVQLVTGRRHQIRAQLSRIGLPVKGDLKYGARRSEKDGGIRLHAHSLAFPLPGGAGGIIRAESPPPLIDNLWRAFLDAARI